jgi:hypothetical protein
MDGGNNYLPGFRFNNCGRQTNVFFNISVLNWERSVINGYGLDEKYSIRGTSRTFAPPPPHVQIITAAHHAPRRVPRELIPAPKQLVIHLRLAVRFTENLNDEMRRKSERGYGRGPKARACCICFCIFCSVITLKNKFKIFLLLLDENRLIFIIWPR